MESQYSSIIEQVILTAGHMLFACGILCTIHLLIYVIHGLKAGKRRKRLWLNSLLYFSTLWPMITFGVFMMGVGGRGDEGMLNVFGGFFETLGQTLWSYDRSSADGYSHFYHWLNIIEGTFWVVFGILVMRRFVKNRHSLIELAYALAFLTFGYSDYHEAVVVQPWLILLKGYILVMLLWLRKIVIRQYYPNSKTY